MPLNSDEASRLNPVNKGLKVFGNGHLNEAKDVSLSSTFPLPGGEDRSAKLGPVKVERIILGTRRRVGLALGNSKEPSRKASPLVKDSKRQVSPATPTGTPSRRRADARSNASLDSGSNLVPRKRPGSRTSFVKDSILKPLMSTHLPVLIMGYMQVIFNAGLIAVLLYFVVSFVVTVRRDVAIKVDQQLSRILAEISQCSRQYEENRCRPQERVPAMETACQAWEACMRRDPSLFGRAKLSAETLAEIVNGLIEPISYKTMVSFGELATSIVFPRLPVFMTTLIPFRTSSLLDFSDQEK